MEISNQLHQDLNILVLIANTLSLLNYQILKIQLFLSQILIINRRKCKKIDK